MAKPSKLQVSSDEAFFDSSSPSASEEEQINDPIADEEDQKLEVVARNAGDDDDNNSPASDKDGVAFGDEDDEEDECKVENEEANKNKNTNKAIIEPKSAEFVSALAAGKRARVMLEVTSEGVTPLTMALAAAAAQTGGRLVCILLRRDQVETGRAHLRAHGLDQVVDLQFCRGNPSQLIGKFSGVDFAVIDCKLEDHVKVYRSLNLNPRGSTVVTNNLDLNSPFLDVFKLSGKNGGVESHVTLPLVGGGLRTLGLISTRFPGVNKNNNNNGVSNCKTQKIIRSIKLKRFHVTFEN